MQLSLPHCGRPQYPQKRIWKLRARLIGWLLYNANSSPPMIRRKEFYDLKTRLLQKYATPGPNDFQHFPQKDCFHCWSHHHCWDCDDFGHCCRCDGTGIYLPEIWITLHTWTLGGFVFHSIGPKRYEPPEAWPKIIEGKIVHGSKPYQLPEECCRWLELLFDTRHFLKYYGCNMYFWKFSMRRPLVSFGTIVGAVRFQRWQLAKALLPHSVYFWLKYRKNEKDAEEIPF